MEVAYLLDDRIYLEEERNSLEQETLSYNEIVKSLERRYRVHSDKKVFTCICCKQPVSMVLRKDKFHFKHIGEGCPSSENYSHYTKQIKGEENEQSHRLGKTMIRTYLEGQLKIHGINVQEGYSYRKTIKIIPDILLYFPNGDIWVVDYITGKKQTEAYNNFIKRRKEIYTQEGFKSFFFIDKSWLSSEHPTFKGISLYPAENQMFMQREQDQLWEVLLANIISQVGEEFILKYLFRLKKDSKQNYSFSVESILYVDPLAGQALIQRLVRLNEQWGLQIYREEISLEQATSLSFSKQQLKWDGIFEVEERTKMEAEITTAFGKYKTEEALAEEIKMKEELNKKLIESEKHISHKQSNYHVGSTHHVHSQIILDSTSINELVLKLREECITVSEANELYDYYKKNKQFKNKSELEEIRVLARTMLGPISSPKLWETRLREIIINLGLL